VHRDIIKVFYSPTDEQVNCLKNNTKIYIKINIKTAPTCFGATVTPVAYPRILFGGRAGSTNAVEDRGQRECGSGGGRPLVWDSRGSCNLVQEISFRRVKFS